MACLNKRVAQLEVKQTNADLKAMTDDELTNHIAALDHGTERWWDAVLADVMRHTKPIPVVRDDPDYATR